jgi:hypothetical protein
MCRALLVRQFSLGNVQPFLWHRVATMRRSTASQGVGLNASLADQLAILSSYSRLFYTLGAHYTTSTG